MIGELWRQARTPKAEELNARLLRVLYHLAEGRGQASIPGVTDENTRREVARAQEQTFAANAVQLLNVCIATGEMDGLGWLERPHVTLPETWRRTLEARALGYDIARTAEELNVPYSTARYRCERAIGELRAESMLHAVVLYRLQQMGEAPCLQCRDCGVRLRFIEEITREGRDLAGWRQIPGKGMKWARCRWCSGALLYRKAAPREVVAAHLEIEPEQVEDLLRPNGVVAARYPSRLDEPEVRHWVLRTHVSGAMSDAQIARILHARWAIVTNARGVRDAVTRWAASWVTPLGDSQLVEAREARSGGSA